MMPDRRAVYFRSELYCIGMQKSNHDIEFLEGVACQGVTILRGLYFRESQYRGEVVFQGYRGEVVFQGY